MTIKTEEPSFSRRALALVGTGMAIGTAACLDTPTASPEDIPLVQLGELAVGATKRFDYPLGGDEAVLIRLGRAAEGGVGPGRDHVAFLRACPHMGCRISTIDTDAAVIGPCPCHRSRFDIAAAGRQIIGRACQRLVQVRLELIGATIHAVGLDGLPYGQALEAE